MADSGNDVLIPGPIVPKRVTGSRKRYRSIVAVLVVLLFIAVAWIVEIDVVLDSVRNNYTPSQAKKCVNLNHRDPSFVNDENKDLCLSQDEVIDQIREIVFTAANLFEAHNVTYFLESGTLLGSYRDRGVIRHDKDADLGIDAAGLDYLRNHSVADMVPDDYHFTVWNSPLYPGSYRDAELPARLIHKKTGMYSDVFAFLDWKNATTGEDSVGPLPSVCFGGCHDCPIVNGMRHFTVPRDWVYPLAECVFERRTFKCPRQSGKYLEHMYGKDYMTPS